MSRIGPIAAGGFLGVALLLAAAAKHPTRPKGPPMPWAAYAELCARWAGLWGLPPLVMQVIGTIESSRIPSSGNTDDPRAAAKGGAWGLFGLTLATARDLVGRVKALKNQAIVKAWNGTAPELLNPELNAAIASYYLGALWKEFGAFIPTVAAYQQGPSTVRGILAHAGDVLTEIGPNGREYVARALAVRQELEGRKAPVS